MELPDSVLNLIVRAEGLQLGAFRREQRDRPRLGVGRRGQIAKLVDGHPRAVPVMIRDVSVSGVGLVHTEPIAVGEVFVLVIPTVYARKGDDNESAGVVLQCQVVRCLRGGIGGAFIIGAVFVQVLRPRGS
jgi:hypothetical protein